MQLSAHLLHETHVHDSICVKSLIHTCDIFFFLRDMTHLYLWHDSFICWKSLIHTCDTTHSYMWHDSVCRYACVLQVAKYPSCVAKQPYFLAEEPCSGAKEPYCLFFEKDMLRRKRPIVMWKMCCSVLQCVAVHCSVLQCVAVCCGVLSRVAVYLKGALVCSTRKKLLCVIWHCNTRQNTTTHYNILQRTATHCNALVFSTRGECLCVIWYINMCQNHVQIAMELYEWVMSRKWMTDIKERSPRL